jgi:hypothetical protein
MSFACVVGCPVPAFAMPSEKGSAADTLRWSPVRPDFALGWSK